MVVRWFRVKGTGWQWRAVLNGVGAIATAVVALVQVLTKFTTGAWIVVIIIPLLILMLRKIHHHYEHYSQEVRFTGHSPVMFLHHTVVVPVNGITKPAAGALVYATTISEDVRAVYVEVSQDATDRLRSAWADWDIGVALTVLASPYRSILRPLVDYVKQVLARGEADLVTIVVAEVVPRRWWEHILHNKTALFIRTAFLFRPNVVVTAVPYLLGRSASISDLLHHDESLDAEPEAATPRVVQPA